jgi:hypothetical protein
LIDMEDNDPEALAQPGELKAAMRSSGYNHYVPAGADAAAAAGGGRPRINHDSLAVVLYASEVEPGALVAWEVIAEKMEQVQEAIQSLSDHLGPNTIPAYADGKDRAVKLPDSVSLTGLRKKERGVKRMLEEVNMAIGDTFTQLENTTEAIYQVALANHKLRHYRKKHAAQEEMKEESFQETARSHISMTAHQMNKNPMKKERLFEQAEKRQKIAPSRGIINRFAKKADK